MQRVGAPRFQNLYRSLQESLANLVCEDTTAGVFLTAVLVAAFALLLFRFAWLEALLLGSVISSTDAAAVFAILRSRNVSLKGRLKPLLELESGSNDPMAAFLTVTMVSLLKNPAASWWRAVRPASAPPRN